VTTLHAKNIES